MLLPALNKARDKAKAIQCSSNLNQLGKYMQLYADDNNGHGHFSPDTNWGSAWMIYKPNTSSFVYYVKDWKKFMCPVAHLVQASDYDAYKIGFNYSICRRADSNRLTRHRSPSKTLLFSDAGPRTASTNYPWSIQSPWSTAKAQASWLLSKRHSGKLNIVCIDGHVHAEGKTPGSGDSDMFTSVP